MPKIEEQIKKKIAETAEKELKLKLDPQEIGLKFPPQIEMGDFCFETFNLAQKANKNPKETAEIIARNIKGDVLEKAENMGPYVNFKVKNQALFQEILREIAKNGLAEKTRKKEKIMIEFLSPNTNKPLHLGHLRNGALGMALSNILEANGNKVIKANLVNDRGVHISKSMLAYKKWGKNETPNMKGDHFVGKFYVKYSQEEAKNPELKQEIQEMLKKWEEGDKETRKLWERMNNWVYQGFAETYKSFGLEFDTFFYESKNYQLGKDIVENGLKKGILQKEQDGSIVALLPEKEFGLNKDKQPNKKVLVRSDGTSVYTTQDLGTAVLKFKKYHLNKSIYIVGSEQDYHFKVLFYLLKALGYEWRGDCFHLSYGMVYLPEGKMKSREGTVVDADNLIAEIEAMALSEIKKRSQISEKEAKERAHKIALGAIKFYLLLPLPKSDVHFDPKQSLSLEGKTGPYCQYAYARARSVLKKAKKQTTKTDLKEKEELLLLQNLLKTKQAFKEASIELNPSKLTQAVYDLSCSFNQFYQALPIATSKPRLKLTETVSLALKQGLNALGIDVLEEM